MKFRSLLFSLLPVLASAQGSELPRPQWILVDSHALQALPLGPLRGRVPEATVIVEGDYPPLFTEREIRFLEFRAALLADLRIHLQNHVSSPPEGALVPVRYGGNGVPRIYPLRGVKWR